jgi:hypothetical protein
VKSLSHTNISAKLWTFEIGTWFCAIMFLAGSLALLLPISKDDRDNPDERKKNVVGKKLDVTG